MYKIQLYVPDGKDFYSLYPTLRMIDFGAFGTTFGQCFNVDFSGVDILNFIAVLFAFLFVDMICAAPALPLPGAAGSLSSPHAGTATGLA